MGAIQEDYAEGRGEGDHKDLFHAVCKHSLESLSNTEYKRNFEKTIKLYPYCLVPTRFKEAVV